MSELKLGDRVMVLGRSEKDWKIHEIHPAGQVTCKRVLRVHEKTFPGYIKDYEYLWPGTEVFVQVASIEHLRIL